jgi:hypothetical protein
LFGVEQRDLTNITEILTNWIGDRTFVEGGEHSELFFEVSADNRSVSDFIGSCFKNVDARFGEFEIKIIEFLDCLFWFWEDR